MKYIFSILLFCLVSCEAQHPKINGISLVSSRSSLEKAEIEPLKKTNANFIAVSPFGFVKGKNNPNLYYNRKNQWYGETLNGIEQYISQLRKNKFKVMLKPQLWVGHGIYTGDISMEDETDWQQFEADYQDFILDFARLAEKNKVELFCIGTELKIFVAERPDYWLKLITEIKKVYSGKLTYAANWDEYKQIELWKELDYIGVDAYFPISETKKVNPEEAKKGWQPWKIELKGIATKFNKQILFTELGYRSMPFAGKEPWTSHREEEQIHLKNQSVLLQVAFDEFWREDWFAGAFLWKWFKNHQESGGKQDNRFTPQNKPAEKIINEHFSKYK
jgi:hypothetical protein